MSSSRAAFSGLKLKMLPMTWNVAHMLSKLMSPAAEAFRYFVLERGEAFLAENFGRHVKLGGPS